MVGNYSDVADVSFVTNMSWMFRSASAFNQDLSTWDTSSVTNMSWMFSSASAFNQDLSTWDTSSVTTMINMFTGSALSSTNYDNILIGWNTLPLLQSNVTLDSPTTYCAGAAARSNIITTYNWTINDAGEECLTTPTVTTQPTTNITATTATGNGEITSTGGEDSERFIEWGTASGIYTNECSAGKGSTGTYTCTMSLIPDTTYYVRAKATNSAGTSYGTETSFTTQTATLYPREIKVKGTTEWKGHVKIKN
jgi:surface protein